eukprot:9154315-Pyramimonas_sp.AAC.1
MRSAFGAVLIPCGAVVKPYRVMLKPHWSVLEACWASFETSGRHLGTNLRPTWALTSRLFDLGA